MWNLYINGTYCKNRMGSVMDKASARKLIFGILLTAMAWMAAGAAFALGQGTVTITVPAPTAAAATTAPTATSSAANDLTFDVASVRPSAPLDMAKLMADMQTGKMPNVGMHVNGLRAEYNYLTLKDLITVAYKVKTYQITGPDWLGTQHFDIVANLPEGTTKDDAPKMLQALLEERFKLKVHRVTQEHPVQALVVGKGGPKMKESPGDAPPLDLSVPLKPGEMQMDTPDEPARMTVDMKTGGGDHEHGNQGNHHVQRECPEHDAAHDIEQDDHGGAGGHADADDDVVGWRGRRKWAAGDGHDRPEGELRGGAGFLAGGHRRAGPRTGRHGRRRWGDEQHGWA